MLYNKRKLKYNKPGLITATNAVKGLALPVRTVMAELTTVNKVTTKKTTIQK